MTALKVRKGFTLVELLIVITIIGVLAVALVPRIIGVPSKGRDAARMADLQQVATGLELYSDSTGTYPASGTASCITKADGSGVANDLLTAGVLSTVPDDPSNSTTGSSPCYSIRTWNSAKNFLIFATVENPAAKTGLYETDPSSVTINTGDNAATVLGSLTDCSSSSSACYYVIAR